MRLPVLLLFLTACSHVPAPPAAFDPPTEAPSGVDLVRMIPPELFKGDLDGGARPTGSSEELTFLFLKDSPEDQVPMRVALYAHELGAPLHRLFVARLPFSDGECRRGECRARIAPYPSGFQISRESFGADHLKEDYRFVRVDGDLALVGEGMQAPGPDGEKCSLYRDYAKRRVLRRHGSDARADPMPDGPSPQLIRDHLRFGTTLPKALCAFAAPAR